MYRVKVFLSVTFLVLIGFCVYPSLKAPTPLTAYSSGPPPGRTGAPGEGTCLFCHFTFPLNDPSGWVRLDGLPACYTSGERVNFTVSVFQDGSKQPRLNWGFQLTVLDSANNAIGTLVATDPLNTQIMSGDIGEGTRFYIEQTLEGTYLNQGLEAGTWSMSWDPPDTDAGPVTFYVAGNAANGDGTQEGDYIFTASQQVVSPSAGPNFAASLHNSLRPSQSGQPIRAALLAMRSHPPRMRSFGRGFFKPLHRVGHQGEI